MTNYYAKTSVHYLTVPSYLWAGNGKTRSFHSLPFPSSRSHSHETSLALSIPMGIPREFPL